MAPNPTVLADGTRTYLPGAPGAGYEEGGTWWTSLADQTGSPLMAVSETGTTTTPVHYDPFGGPRAGSPATGIGYAGEWRDPAGLVNLRSRAYDPAVGRFTSRDTFAGVLSAPQTGNRYAYALNNPYRYTDPSGRFVTWAVSNGPMLTSAFVQAIPGVGDAYSFMIGAIGYDPIAGVALSDAERGMAIASAVVIGGGFWLAGRLADDAVRDVGMLGRAVDDAPTGGASGAETFYRTMSADDYSALLATGRVRATHETFVSPSATFASRYEGVTVEIRVRSGTTDALAQVGVRDDARITATAYPNLPLVSPGWTATSAYFKAERGIINIGLGQGPGLSIFNDSILGFREVPR